MESKEKCEQIINIFNNQTLQGAKEPLLVKFADGGQKKRSPFRNDNRIWREATEALCAQGGHVTYDPSVNGVGQHMMPAAYNSYGRQPLTTYPLHTPSPWPMQYVMHPPPHMTQVDNHGVLQMMQDPTSAVQYASVIPQLTTQLHALQLATPPYIASAPPYQFYPAATSIIHAPMAVTDNEHNSNTASPEEAYTTYPPPK